MQRKVTGTAYHDLQVQPLACHSQMHWVITREQRRVLGVLRG